MSQIGMRISAEEKDKLTRIASSKDLTISHILRRMVKEYIRKEEAAHESLYEAQHQ